MSTHKPKQNRVTPYGEIVATSERGMFMGNRGILHNDQQEIVTPFITKAWIICQLEFDNRKRKVMGAGTYTELFFLDEATALAAGHRPCCTCRQERCNYFRKLWADAHGNSVSGHLKVGAIDVVLHEERLTTERLKKNRRKRAYVSLLSDLPDGTIVEMGKRPFLLWNAHLHPWTLGGYQSPIPASSTEPVVVLTPPSTVAVLAQGYVPEVLLTVNMLNGVYFKRNNLGGSDCGKII